MTWMMKDGYKQQRLFDGINDDNDKVTANEIAEVPIDNDDDEDEYDKLLSTSTEDVMEKVPPLRKGRKIDIKKFSKNILNLQKIKNFLF